MPFRTDGLFIVFRHSLPREKDILRTACREKQPEISHKSEDSKKCTQAEKTGIVFLPVFESSVLCNEERR